MKRYHLLVDMTWALGVPRRDLQHKLWCETGERFSRWTLRRKLRQAQARNYVMLPLCDAVDDRGCCKGHEDAQG